MTRPGGTSRVTLPATGAGPHATVSDRPAGASVPPGASSVTWSGDMCTATGRFPAGAGPLPCSQYRVNTGCAGSAPAGAAVLPPLLTGNDPAGAWFVQAWRATS